MARWKMAIRTVSIMTPDFINGLFEGLGALMICISIRRVLIDRMSRGVSPWSILFFTVWGYWNLYFYAHLGQSWSLSGAVLMVASNTTRVGLLIYYRRKEIRELKLLERTPKNFYTFPNWSSQHYQK